MFGIGAPELVLILVLALIFIGPQKLPEMARMFGKSYRELQRALDGVKGEFATASSEMKHEVDVAPVPPNILDAGNLENASGGTAKTEESNSATTSGRDLPSL